MDLGFDETQSMIRDSAREFLARASGSEYIRAMESDPRGFTDELWRGMAQLGWPGLAVPERFGGAGMGLVELAIVLEEMGAAALPGPFFSTAVTGAAALTRHASEAQKTRYLPGLAAGDLITALAFHEAAASWDLRSVHSVAAKSEEGWRLNGEKLFVPDARVADLLIVAARTEPDASCEEGPVTVFLVERAPEDGIDITPLDSVADDRLCALRFRDVTVPPDAVLGEVGGGAAVLRDVLTVGAAAKAAEMLGGARRVLEMTVEFAKERVQFGRPIGAFQAIQHRCAEMAIDVQAARQLTYQAVWRLDAGLPAERAVAMAKSWLSNVFPNVCAEAHQTHGAIGFTREHDLQIFTRRAAAARPAFGDAWHFREAVVESIGL